MKKKIETRKKFGRICALVVVGMFVAMTSMSVPADDPDDWTRWGNNADPTWKLGTLNDEDLRIITNDIQRMVVTSAGNVGIGTANPAERLDVAGTVQMTGFKMPTGALSGYVLTSDANGAGTWQPAPSGSIGGSGTANYIPKFTGSTTLGNSIIYQSSSNIGIGTTSPDKKLSVIGVVRGAYNTGETEYTEIGHGGSHGYINTVGDGRLDFRHDSSTKMSLTDSGNVGIGTTSPSQALHVAGNARITGALYDSNNDAGTNGQILGSTGSGIDWVDLSPVPDDDWIISGNDMYSGVSGNVGIGTTSPTAKTHIIQTAAADAFRVDDEASDTTPFVIDQDGRVGIGTTSPTEALDVVGNFHTSGSFISGSTTTYGDGFITLSAGTNLDIDSETLFIDNANDRVGIGTDSPTAELHVVGDVKIDSGDLNVDSGTLFVDNTNNRVGIGTTSPNAKLGVLGSVAIDANDGNAFVVKIESTPYVRVDTVNNYIGFLTVTGGNNAVQIGQVLKVDGTGDSYFRGDLAIGTTTAGSRLEVWGSGTTSATSALKVTDSTGTSLLFVRDDGNVGIGTTGPYNPLEILSSTTPQVRITHTDATDYATFSVDGEGQLDITTVDGAAARGHICLMPDGYVGIGTTSPGEKLSVAGDVMIGSNTWVQGTTTGDLAIEGKVGIGTADPKYSLDVDGDIDVSGYILWPETDVSSRRLHTKAGHRETYWAGTILETNRIKFETTGTAGQVRVTPKGISIYASFSSTLRGSPNKREILNGNSYTYTLTDEEIGWFCWETSSGTTGHGMYFMHSEWEYIMIYCLGEYDQSG